MILRTVEVEGWRTLAEGVAIGPLADGLNVIFGPNGTGKSTLLEVVLRTLFDTHRVGGAAVQVLKPWGRDLAPRARIEFEHSGEKYRIEKRFLSSPLANLSRHEGDRFVPLAEGEAADRRVRELLGAEAPGRGLSDGQHWGLAQVLWAPQGRLPLPEKLSSGTAEAIRSSLGAQVAGQQTGALEAKLLEAYDRIYTRTGKLKTGKDAPRLTALEQELAAARECHCKALAALHAFDEASRRIEDLRHQGQLAAQREQQLAADAKQARERCRQYEVLLGEHQTAKAKLTAAEAAYRQLVDRVKEIGAARAELTASQQELARLSADLPAQGKLVESSREAVERAKLELDRIRGRRLAVDAAQQRARRAEQFVTTQGRLTDLETRLSQAAELRQQRMRLRAQSVELAAPDRKTLQRLSDAARQSDEACVRLDAALVSLTLSAERDIVVELVSGETPGEQSVAASSSQTFKGSPDVVLRIPGVGVLRASGPATSAEELRAVLAKAEASYAALSAPFGTSDLDQLRDRHEQARELDNQTAQVDARIETLLAGRESEELESERAQTSRTLAEHLAAEPTWVSQPPTVEELRREAKQINDEFVAQVEAAEARWEQAEKAYSQADKRQAGWQADLKSKTTECAKLGTRLEQLLADGHDDAARTAELDERALAVSATRAEAARVKKQLDDYAGDPRQETTVLERQYEAVRKSAQEAVADASREEGRLAQLASQSPYSALAEAEEAIERLQEEFAREQLAADAIRLLHDTWSACRRAAVEAVLEPVESRASLSLERIAGPRLGGIRFSESFVADGVRPALPDVDVPLTELSGGEQEQVHLAVRLALADVLYRGERELLVLDDVLTATDTTRLARVLTLLAEAAERFQVVVLTCHPENYRGLADATFWDLAELRHRHAAQREAGGDAATSSRPARQRELIGQGD